MCKLLGNRATDGTPCSAYWSEVRYISWQAWMCISAWGANCLAHVCLACGRSILLGICTQTLIRSVESFFSSLAVYESWWIYAGEHCSVSLEQWMPVGEPITCRKLKQRNGCSSCLVLPGKWPEELFTRAKFIWTFVIWLTLFPVHTPVPSPPPDLTLLGAFLLFFYF